MFRFDTFARYKSPLLKVYWPFMAGGVLTMYLIKKAADAQAMTDDFINDPRNRLAQLKAKHEKH